MAAEESSESEAEAEEEPQAEVAALPGKSKKIGAKKAAKLQRKEEMRQARQVIRCNSFVLFVIFCLCSASWIY